MNHASRSTAGLFSLLLALGAAPAQSEQPNANHLFVDYRCQPADRPAFRRALAKDGIAQLEQWQQAGAFADYVLVFNEFVDANTWDAVLVLTFASYAQTAKWRAIERDFPGGLSPELLKFGTPQTSYFADRMLSAGEAGDRSKSVFVFIPYQFRAREEYLNFIKVYGVPQFEAWRKADVVANYAVYVNHHHTGKPWDAMLVFEYRDVDALGRRDAIKQQVRVGLAKDAAWKAMSDVKRDLRTELEVVMAAPLQPPK
jgi:hypothetical protein